MRDGIRIVRQKLSNNRGMRGRSIQTSDELNGKMIAGNRVGNSLNGYKVMWRTTANQVDDGPQGIVSSLHGDE